MFSTGESLHVGFGKTVVREDVLIVETYATAVDESGQNVSRNDTACDAGFCTACLEARSSLD